jgi:hypothetical protein
MSDIATSLVGTPTSPVQSTEPESKVAEGTEQPKVEEGAKPKDDFLAPKFAALTRKEKQVREMERAVKAQQAEIEKMRTEWESKSKASQESESQLLSKLKKNPLKALSELGFSYEQLTEMQINDENPTPQMLMEQMRAELEAKMEEKYGKITENLKEKEEREAREQYETAVNSYKSELSEFVKANAETYELIAANNATDLMFESAEEYFKKYQQVPDMQELAKAVEEHLEERANDILKLKKIQNKFAKAPAETKPSKETAPTLSNTLAAEVPKSGSKLLTAEQSLKEAAKHIRWND